MRVLTIGSKTMKRYCVLLFVAVFVFVFCIAQLLCGVGNGGEDTADFDVTIDTYIVWAYPDSHYEEREAVGSGGQSYIGYYRGMLYYDISDIPPGTELVSAIWNFYVLEHQEETAYNYKLYEITENWVDQPSYEWTWNNYHDSYDEDNPQLTHPSVTYGWYEKDFDEISVLQEWVDNPSTNYGFMWIRDNDTEDPLVNSYVWITSIEGWIPENKSYLSITWTCTNIQSTSIGYIRALLK